MSAWNLFYGLLLASEAAMLWYVCGLFFDFRFERYNRLVLLSMAIVRLLPMLVGEYLALPGYWGTVSFFIIDYLCLQMIFVISWARRLVICSLFYAAVATVDLLVLLLLERMLALPHAAVLSTGTLFLVEATVARLLLLLLVQILPSKLLAQRFYVSNSALLLYALAPLASSLLLVSMLLRDGLILQMRGLDIIFFLVWLLNTANMHYFNSREQARRQLRELQAGADL